MSGWMCRAPKLMTGSGAAASTHSRAAVAHPMPPPADAIGDLDGVPGDLHAGAKAVEGGRQHRVDLQTEDGTLDTYIFQPVDSHQGKPWPAVVMYMDAFGIRPALGDAGAPASASWPSDSPAAVDG